MTTMCDLFFFPFSNRKWQKYSLDMLNLFKDHVICLTIAVTHFMSIVKTIVSFMDPYCIFLHCPSDFYATLSHIFSLYYLYLHLFHEIMP